MKKLYTFLFLMCFGFIGMTMNEPVYAADSCSEAHLDVNASRDMGIPVGSVITYSESMIGSLPKGYHLCDGSKFKKTDYPKLYNLIGTAYNTGDESSDEFRIPDLRGKFIRGYDSNADTRFGNEIGKTQESTVYYKSGNANFKFNCLVDMDSAKNNPDSLCSGGIAGVLHKDETVSFTAKKATTAGKVINGILTLGLSSLSTKMKSYNMGTETTYTFNSNIGAADQFKDDKFKNESYVVPENMSTLYYVRMK